MTSQVNQPTHQSRGVGRVIGAALLVIVGVVAGILLNEPIRHMIGRHDHAGTTAGASTSAPAEKKQLWTCGMHPNVIQDQPGICPICHMDLEPMRDVPGADEAASSERKIRYWWDASTNPPFISDKPGQSPAGIDLVPVYEDEVAGGTAVTIDPVIIQNMGIRLAEVKQGSVQQTVRAVGYLVEPESMRRDINLRVTGWIEKLYANTEGMPIEKGQKLFDLYSPEIRVAVGELIAARKASRNAVGVAATQPGGASVLYDSTRRKLELWGLLPEQVEELSKLDAAPSTVSILAPIHGHLVELDVSEGAALEMGQRAMRLANRSQMWLDTQVFERQLPLINVGQTALASIWAFPGKQFEGKVEFIHPHIDPNTRTALVRVVLANEDHSLKQGMYATVELQSDPQPPTPLVPREAVIDTGTRQIAFVAAPGGRFEPRAVKIGMAGNDDTVQVLRGLAPGEKVVTSGQFLLDSESRLREAVQKHLSKALATNVATQAPVTTTAQQPATRPAGPTITVPHLEDITAAYLRLSDQLGKPQASDQPVDVGALLEAAQLSTEHATGEAEPLLKAVVAAIQPMQGKDLGMQREQFVTVSEAIIAVLDRAPPAQQVFVAHCPMAFHDNGASWLQSSGDAVRNPFYATKMKNCGEIVRTIGAQAQ